MRKKSLLLLIAVSIAVEIFQSGCAGCSEEKGESLTCSDVYLSVTPLQGREPLEVYITLSVEKNPYRYVGVKSGDSDEWLLFQEFDESSRGVPFSRSFTHVFLLPEGSLEKDYAIVVTAVAPDGSSCNVRSAVIVRKNLAPLISCDSRDMISTSSCACSWLFNVTVYDDGVFNSILLDFDGDGEFDYDTGLTGVANGERVNLSFEFCSVRMGIYKPRVKVIDDGGQADIDECEVVPCVCTFDYFGKFQVKGNAKDVITFQWEGNVYAVVNYDAGGLWILNVSQPASPTLTGWIPSIADDMVIHNYSQGPVLFSTQGGIRMYDLSDPADPQLIPASVSLSLSTRKIDVLDSPSGVTIVYLMQEYDRVYFCDVSDPYSFSSYNCSNVNIGALTGSDLLTTLNDIAVFEDGGYHYLFVSYYGVDSPDSLFVAKINPQTLQVVSWSVQTFPRQYPYDVTVPVLEMEIDPVSRVLYTVEYDVCSATVCNYGVRLYGIPADPITTPVSLFEGCRLNNQRDGLFEYYYPKTARDIFPVSPTRAFIAWENHGWQGIYVDPTTGGCTGKVSSMTCFQMKETADTPDPVTCVVPPTGAGEAFGIAFTSYAGGEYVFTSDGERGLVVHKLRPLSVSFTSHIDLGNAVRDFDTYGIASVVVTAEGDGGVSVLDFSQVNVNNRSPAFRARVDVDEPVNFVDVTQEGYLYFTGTNTLYVYSITQPSNPRFVYSLPGLSNPSCLEVIERQGDDLAVVCVSDVSGYKLIFVKRTGETFQVEGETTAMFYSDLLVSGTPSRVYVTSATEVYRFDLSSLPGTLIPDASAALPEGVVPSVIKVSSDGQYLYIAGGLDLYLAVMDADLRFISSYSIDVGYYDDIRDMFYREVRAGSAVYRYIIATTYLEGIFIFDVTDPSDIIVNSRSPSAYVTPAFHLGVVSLPSDGGNLLYLLSDGASGTGTITLYRDTCW